MTEASSSRPGLLRAGILALPLAERQRALAMHVQRMAAGLLQLDDPQQVTLDTPWTELGFDSLRAVDLCAALAHELDLPLRSTLLFDQPQPRALVEHLVARIGDAVTATARTQHAPEHARSREHRERAAIAIVGAACRLPGADGLEAFWNLLLDGRDAVVPIPRERFDTDALFDPDPATPGAIYVRHAALLDDLAGFDAAAFGISPREAAALDPQQRLLLEAAWHAFEHANLPPHRLAAHRVGVYVGIRSGEYFDSQTARTPADADAYYHTGNALSTAAGRIAYTFGFRGPCLSIDTACSGSLVALHTAVRALRTGECDVALVAGVNAILDPVSMAGLCRARMLSKDGRCKSFDARADGYGRGEGCGAVVLRRHEDAEAAGERILALVLGTAINQDGRSGGLTVPHGPAQQEVVGMALADAGIAPSAIDYVEAHGTGTSLGDPIEVAALDAAFAARERSLPIGSVKTSIGHLEAAAGIAGLLKVVLSLRARMLPANLHFETPNPHVDWARSRVRVVTALEAMRADGPLFAGVSSFGFSGTNAHAVLGSAPVANAASAIPSRGPFLLPLQAIDGSALRELAHRHAECLARGSIDLATWCHTAAIARRPLPVRAAFVARDAATFVQALVAFADGDVRAASAVHGVRGDAANAFDAFDERTNDDAGTQPFASARAGSDPAIRALHDLARRWARGDDVDLAVLHTGAPTAELPTYPFQRRRHWHTRVDRPHARPTGAHPLLGERRDTSLLAEGQSLFAASLAATQPSWLADHRLERDVVLPAAVAIELCWAAELAHGRELPLVVEGVTIRARVALGVDPTALELLRSPNAECAFDVRVRARAMDGTWFDVIDGEVPLDARVHDETADVDALATATARCTIAMDARTLYERCAALSLAYGPAFRAVHDVRLGDAELIARVRLPSSMSTTGFALHPVLFDACWHVATALLPADSSALLPVAVERATVWRRDVRDLVCHLRVRSRSKNHCVVDCALYDESGNLVARLDGLQSMAAVAPVANHPALDASVHHTAFVELDDDERIAPPSRIAVLGWPRLAEALCAAWPSGRAIAIDAQRLAAAGKEPFDAVLWLAEPQHERADHDAVLDTFDDALAAVQAGLALPGRPRFVLVTHGIADATPSPAGAVPHAAALLGLWRTLAHEHADTRPFAIDLDPHCPSHAVAAHAAAVADELHRPANEPEIALRNGRRLARRLRRGPAASMPRTRTDGPFRVRTEAYGAFESLRCMPLARRAPARGEVEVAMVAAALNFKDVLYARGLLRDFAARDGVHSAKDQPLGFEGSGIVVATGPDVASLREGDRVAVLAPDCLATHVTVRADAVFALPDGCDPVAAAGTPIAFATAIHALLERANVQRGETVLVHTAAGGVGQAAIQLLHDLGARVLATCSRGKQAFVKALGASVVGSGRAHDFAPDVLAATNGRGVDVVLNTRTGDGVPRSLEGLRRGGRFVELGKLGVWTAEQVRSARPDVHYHAFDLGEVFAADPTQKPRLLARVRDLLHTGRIRPVTTTAMPIERATAAFAHLADGASLGKVVLTLPATNGPRLRPDRTYLVAGASGGFGPALANALVEAGARHLALLARGPIADSTCAALREKGCAVTTLAADVADATSLATALAHLRANGPPLGGLVHAAGALADATLLQLDATDAHAALRAKVTGTLLLDRLTADDPLEFFATTGSMAATLGSAGQAAYAAANAFLEGLSAHRRARGRPSTCIALGPLDGAGMTQRLSAPLRARLARRGISLLPEAHAARLVVARRNAPFDLSVLPIDWAEWRQALGQQAMPVLAELDPAHATTPSPSTPYLSSLPLDERRARLRRVVAEAIADALGFADAQPVLGDRAFRDLGLDSLLAVEAKEQIEERVGRRLPATLLFDFPDLESLVAHLAAHA